MITIVLRQSVNVLLQIKVCSDATPGSWGSHQLLLHQYRLEAENEQWAQAKFNYRWLKDMELDWGPLWCSYCGQEDLHIYHFFDKHDHSDMATTDHFIPKSEAPHLAMNKKNLVVCCWNCNNKKANKRWEIKYPYD